MSGYLGELEGLLLLLLRGLVADPDVDLGSGIKDHDVIRDKILWEKMKVVEGAKFLPTRRVDSIPRALRTHVTVRCMY